MPWAETHAPLWQIMRHTEDPIVTEIAKHLCLNEQTGLTYEVDNLRAAISMARIQNPVGDVFSEAAIEQAIWDGVLAELGGNLIEHHHRHMSRFDMTKYVFWRIERFFVSDTFPRHPHNIEFYVRPGKTRLHQINTAVFK